MVIFNRSLQQSVRNSQHQLVGRADLEAMARQVPGGVAPAALHPGERLIACRNPMLAEDRARKREELLAATEEKLERIAEEAALDGIYVVRTSLPAERLEAEEAVAAYKRLSEVERAFRAYKGVDLKVRPIHHWRAERVRAHVFLCTLACYVEWHMKRRLEPLLSGENGDGEHSFPTLLSDLATLTQNTVRVGEHITFEQVSRPTELQSRTLDLLEVKPRL